MLLTRCGRRACVPGRGLSRKTRQGSAPPKRKRGEKCPIPTRSEAERRARRLDKNGSCANATSDIEEVGAFRNSHDTQRHLAARRADQADRGPAEQLWAVWRI